MADDPQQLTPSRRAPVRPNQKTYNTIRTVFATSSPG